MKTNTFKIAWTVLLVLFVIYVSGQDKTLVGKVTTFDSIPLVGVNIEVKSTGQSVQTDLQGRYQLFCNPKDKLTFSANGFSEKKVKVKEDTKMLLLNMNLKKGDDNLAQAERYVNVGYGYVSSKELLYSISHASQDDIDFSNYDTVLDAIQGEFPGVHIENEVIVVRGIKTFQTNTFPTGNSAVLASNPGIFRDNNKMAATVVIDGIISNYSDLASVSPLDVKNVNVLKDGSSSVYGSRGANGVVIIETIKGGNK